MRADDGIVTAIASGTKTKTICKKLPNELAKCEEFAAKIDQEIDHQRLVELLAPFFVSQFTDDEIEEMIRFYASDEGKQLTDLMIKGLNWTSPQGALQEPVMTEKLAAYLQSPVSRKLTELALPFSDEAKRKVGPYLCTVLEPRGFSCSALTQAAMLASAMPAGLGMMGSQSALRSAEDSYQRDADIVRARYLLEWARIIEAYHKKSGYYPLQRRVKGEEAIRVPIATREQQAQLSRPRDDPRSPRVSVKGLVADIEAVLEREIDERYDPQRVPTGAPNYFSYFATKNGYLIWAVCRTCPPSSKSFTVPLSSGVLTINIGSTWFVDNIGKTQSIDSLQRNQDFVEFIGNGPASTTWFEQLERAQAHESKK